MYSKAAIVRDLRMITRLFVACPSVKSEEQGAQEIPCAVQFTKLVISKLTVNNFRLSK